MFRYEGKKIDVAVTRQCKYHKLNVFCQIFHQSVQLVSQAKDELIHANFQPHRNNKRKKSKPGLQLSL